MKGILHNWIITINRFHREYYFGSSEIDVNLFFSVLTKPTDACEAMMSQPYMSEVYEYTLDSIKQGFEGVRKRNYDSSSPLDKSLIRKWFEKESFKISTKDMLLELNVNAFNASRSAKKQVAMKAIKKKEDLDKSKMPQVSLFSVPPMLLSSHYVDNAIVDSSTGLAISIIQLQEIEKKKKTAKATKNKRLLGFNFNCFSFFYL